MADISSSYTYKPVASAADYLDVHPHTHEQGQLWRQYLVGAVANIVMLSCGYCMVWMAPTSIKLMSSDTSRSPLGRSVTTDEIAWLGSSISVGFIIGSFSSGFAASTIGRKWTLLLSAIPFCVGWSLASLATSMGYLYAARILWGGGTGLVFVVYSVYCAEIATVECRGVLGSFQQSFNCIGFLLMYSVGPYMSYHAVTYIGLALVALFAILFFFMPESPFYCVLKGRVDDARQNLMMLRGRSRQGVEDELAMIEQDVAVSKQNTATFRDVFRGGNFKALYILVGLMFFQQFSSINAVLFYMTDIFRASGTNVEPAVATIIVAIVQLLASFITPMFVDRLGRRPLLLVSSCGTAVSLALLGAFFLLAHMGSPIVERIGFLPVPSVVLLIITTNLGLGPLPWAMLGELLPIEVRAVAAPIATAACGIISFVVTKCFVSISFAYGMHVAFFICCAFAGVAFLFALLVVPETRGKSFQEIREMLNGTNPVDEKLKSNGSK